MDKHEQIEKWYDRRVNEALIEKAKTLEDFAWYGDLIRLAGLDQYYSGDGLSGALGWVLWAVVQKDLSEDKSRPMISAIGLPKNGTRPSDGFFELARELGRLDSHDQYEEDIFWLNELKKLRAYWQVQI
ncbi:MAG: hypothetical protein JXJ17_19935 [Anaerolineae bacterium]|nr:hypothetical protein [Anaerolineae bacterium]